MWLDKNHKSSGVWLRLQEGTIKVFSMEGVEVALLWWIDGQKERYDESFWLQKVHAAWGWTLVKDHREKAQDLIRT